MLRPELNDFHELERIMTWIESKLAIDLPWILLRGPTICVKMEEFHQRNSLHGFLSLSVKLTTVKRNFSTDVLGLVDTIIDTLKKAKCNTDL